MIRYRSSADVAEVPGGAVFVGLVHKQVNAHQPQGADVGERRRAAPTANPMHIMPAKQNIAETRKKQR